MCKSLRVTEFSIDTEHRENVAFLAVAGAVDLSTVPALRTESSAALADPDVSGLVLDFGRLTFLDSTGLGCLVELRQLAVTSGKSFALTSVGPETARVLELGGLGGFFDIAPEPDLQVED
jgi:anti-anti-sigma factor